MDHLADAPIANILILAGVIFLAVGLFGRVGGFIGSIFGNIEAGKNSRVLAGILGAFLIVGGGWLHQQGDKKAIATLPTTTPAAPPAPSPVVAPPGPSRSPKPAHGMTKTTTKPNTVSPSPIPAPTPASTLEHMTTTDPNPPIGDDRILGTWTNVITRSIGIKRIEIARAGQSLSAHLWYACGYNDCDQGIHTMTMVGNRPAYDDTHDGLRRVGAMSLYAPGVMLLSIDLFYLTTQNHKRNNAVFVKSTAPDRVREGFAQYVDAPPDKAFVMSPGGEWSYQSRENSTDDAARSALRHCEQRGTSGCRILFVDEVAQ
jgi:hypothetical protein